MKNIDVHIYEALLQRMLLILYLEKGLKLSSKTSTDHMLGEKENTKS